MLINTIVEVAKGLIYLALHVTGAGAFPKALSAAEEKLLAAAGEMSQAPSNIFGAFSNADLKFPDAVDGQGQKHPLTQGTFISYQEKNADYHLF